MSNVQEAASARDAADNAPPLEYNECRQAVRQLSDFLSHELRPDEEQAVQQHLARCRGCFARFSFEEALLRAIREKAEQGRAPDALRARVLDLVRQS